MSAIRRETVIVVSPTWTSDRGRDVPSFASPTLTTYTDCSVQPLVSPEIHAERMGVVTRWKLIGPSTMTLTAHDRIRHDGVDYEIEGSPQKWKSPTASLDHTEATLKRVDG